jgi:hypothetical protein
MSSELYWDSAGSLGSLKYTCGYCGAAVASDQGWCTFDRDLREYGEEHIRVCPHCGRPTFFETPDKQIPGIPFGHAVMHVPETSVIQLYEEARRATAEGCFTAATLCCRKLLMHIAVAKGAKPGESFASYVEYLMSNNYIPPDAKEWVDYIRSKGNEANHQIVIMSREDAEILVSFVEMLLKIIYEFPAEVRKRIKP